MEGSREVGRTRFNSRSRGGSDLGGPRGGPWRPWFQFTLPRGERPAEMAAIRRVAAVSIHAPAGGATFSFFRLLLSRQVSIHAPAGGATRP